MPPQKHMTAFFIGTFLILLAIALGVWCIMFFGHANPQLPQANVTIQDATVTTSSMAVASSDVDNGSATNTVASPTPTSSVNMNNNTDQDSDADVNTALPSEQLSIDKANFTVEVASTMLQQARGLSNRPSLGMNAGMLFIFSSQSTQSFWMKDMNFPLDMIWISGNTVVGFTQNAPAEQGVIVPSQIFYSPGDTDKVLEVNAGTVAKYNIKVGDTVTIGAVR